MPVLCRLSYSSGASKEPGKESLAGSLASDKQCKGWTEAGVVGGMGPYGRDQPIRDQT